MKMRKLYRQYKSFDEGFLQVSPTHKIYYEQSGNPNGKPVVRLHGGPGSKSKPKHRKVFDPKKWRVIMFDQRGCGQSTPVGEIKDNTTQDLVEDTEKLKKYLEIDKWTVFGSSWGSTLALAYAETYPESINSLILSSIFLARKKDSDWLLVGKELKNLFPDLWKLRKENMKMLDVDINNPLPKLYKILHEGSKKRQRQVSAIFQNWEGQIYDVNQKVKIVKPSEIEDSDMASDKVLLHYVLNDCFLKPNQLLKNARKLPKVPTVILHGRYDVVCPLEQAWELKCVVPHARFAIVPGAGHSTSGSLRYINEIIRYTDRFAK